jgi:hypothetical protein
MNNVPAARDPPPQPRPYWSLPHAPIGALARDGSIGAYSGGVAAKRRLVALEVAKLDV